jgi:di/tricarboxylate transporter
MELFYYVVFFVLTMVLGALELSKSGKDRVVTNSAFKAFKNNYLVVYSLMMGILGCLNLLCCLWNLAGAAVTECLKGRVGGLLAFLLATAVLLYSEC